ncbi:MAG: cobalamin B12-binding domain-containing protein [Deltaproteobacteria bacterium]|nr:cobalamin B12-binding domain-containing protein [Deltaproteobacteria bacterium]
MSTAQNTLPAATGASEAFQQALPKLVVFVNDKFALENRFACDGVACKHMDIAREFTRRFGDLLLGVYSFDLVGQLPDEAAAHIASLDSRGIKPPFVEALLKSWIMAIQCLVKREAADQLIPAVQHLLQQLPSLYERLQKPPEALPAEAQPFFDLLMAKNRKFAAENILSRIRDGASIESVYSDILLPALERMRLLWLQNKVSAVDERAADDISRYVILRVIDSIFGERRFPFRALVACMPGEQEALDVEVFANFLEIKGWSVYFLGSDVSDEDIMYAILKNSPQAVVLAVSSIAGLPEAQRLIAQLREKYPQIKLAVHGRAALLARQRLAAHVDLFISGLEGGHSELLKKVLPDA